MATWQQIKNKTDYVTVITTPSIEKLPVAQSGKKKKLVSFGTRNFKTVFQRARHCAVLSHMNPIQSHKVYVEGPFQ